MGLVPWRFHAVSCGLFAASGPVHPGGFLQTPLPGPSDSYGRRDSGKIASLPKIAAQPVSVSGFMRVAPAGILDRAGTPAGSIVPLLAVHEVDSPSESSELVDCSAICRIAPALSSRRPMAAFASAYPREFRPPHYRARSLEFSDRDRRPREARATSRSRQRAQKRRRWVTSRQRRQRGIASPHPSRSPRAARAARVPARSQRRPASTRDRDRFHLFSGPAQLLHPVTPRGSEIGIDRHGAFELSVSPRRNRILIGGRERPRAGCQLPRDIVHGEQHGSIHRLRRDHLMAGGILDLRLEMQAGAAAREISMDQTRGPIER